ncbi:MAG: IPT/TIG domain-containing protein [Candidatus Obscuribacterales bacterium]|nr:IPT/TIG domain-containing protein [Candidatus Obscuribacterales bacterium]
MKHALLTALSIILVSQSSALAEGSRSSAGAANPVKLGGETRLKPAAKAPASSQSPEKTTGPAAPEKVIGAESGSKTASTLPAQPGSTWKTWEKGSKSLVPPPPNVMNANDLGPSKRKARRKAGSADSNTAPVSKLVTVGSAGPYNFKGLSKEEYSATFNWQPDAASDNLTLNLKFSPVGELAGPHFNWLRVTLGNRILATEQSLKGKSALVVDLTGTVDNGTNQITISGQGNAGATVDWVLTTPRKVKLTQVNPDEVVVGEDLSLKGENFDPSPSKDTVTIGKKNLTATSATATDLKVKIPRDFTPGEYMVKVTVDGLSSKEKKVTVRGIPELTGTNLNGVPPGAQLVIYGKNFSKKMNENTVTMDGVNAQVVNCSTEQLTVVVPNFSNELSGDTARIAGQVGIPIKVKVGKIESKNTVPINVGNSTWMDPGLQDKPGVPEVPVDWRRLMEN